MNDSVRSQLLAIYADEYRDHVAALRAAVTEGGGGDYEEAYRHAHSLKGAARAVEMDAVMAIAHALEGLLQHWWEGGATPEPRQRALALRALDAVEDLSAAGLAGGELPPTHPVQAELESELGAISTPAPCAPCAPCAPSTHPRGSEGGRVSSPPPSTLRVQAGTIERLTESAAGLLVEVGRVGEIEHALRGLQRGLETLPVAGGEAEWRGALAGLRTALVEAVGDLAERDWALALAAAALRDDLQRLRLVTADSVLGGFGPMVRELASEEGKRVRLEMQGMTTQADRDVLRALIEAVRHLLGNAVHHGIEPPEERRAKGKDPEGLVVLSVRLDGTRLVLRVGDDGRGIDTQAVARVAAARGLAMDGGPRDLERLIFLPGFSTAGTVTTEAGRGMGMSVAQTVAARLQGKLEVDSPPGAGTTVSMVVPLAALAQSLLLMEVRGEIFALPVASVRRLSALSDEDLVAMEGGAVALIDGVQTRLVDLGGLLGLPGHTRSGQSICVAVLDYGPMRLGLVADLFVDVRECLVNALEGPLAGDGRLAGTVSLPDGRVVPVLAPAALSALADVAGAPASFQSSRIEGRTVLVVDDSATMRTLERILLETRGHKVVLAEDGADALDKMAATTPTVVVSDVEMPRLDGFALLAAMRDDPRLAKVPVILVSSRDNPEDHALGARLGAVAYLSKTAFDQDEFLRIVEGVA